MYTSMLAGNPTFIETAYESIATTTVGSGGQSSISFTSIPSTYKHLQVRFLGRGTNASSSVDVFIRYNGSTSTYYRGHQLYGEGSSAFGSADSATASGYAGYVPGSTNTVNAFGAGVVDVLDYTNTNKNKVSKSLTGYDSSANGIILLRSSLWQTTSAITQIEFVCSAGNFAEYSSFALYGIKG
jgi:hypothetical protein